MANKFYLHKVANFNKTRMEGFKCRDLSFKKVQMLQQDNLPCHVFFSVKASIVYWSEWTCHVTVHNWKLCFVSQIGAPFWLGPGASCPPCPPPPLGGPGLIMSTYLKCRAA